MNAPAKVFNATVIAILLIALITLLVGGGFGKKHPLPDSLLLENRPLLFAHRGVPAENLGIPENSAPAFTRALNRGYRWIEMDIQQSADGQFFIFHDPTGARLVGSDTRLSELSLAEIQKTPLLINGAPSAETVPALDQVVTSCGDSANFYFDLKLYHTTNQFALADEIFDFIHEHSLTERVIVASQSLRFTLYLEYKHPEIVTLLEISSLEEMQWIEALPQLFKPDMYAYYTRHVTAELGEWLVAEDMQDRLIAFHITEETFPQAIGWGITRFMIDDAPYLDSLLPQR